MAKLLSEIEATAGPAIHTRTVNADGLTPEGEAPATKRSTVRTRDLAIVRNEELAAVEPTEGQTTDEQPAEQAVVDVRGLTENSPPQAVGLEPMRLGERALWLQPEVPTLAC